ncbi:MAG: 4-alpha-glucanotransferase [Verrucomicrobiota bacterium]
MARTTASVPSDSRNVFRCRAFPVRTAGLLLHPTSLAGEGPVGSLGSEARAFIDMLAEAGFGWWQVCPLGPTGYGNSPYQALSVFAGNPYLLDLEALRSDGLLTSAETAALGRGRDADTDYGRLWTQLRPALDLAAGRAATALRHDREFAAFRESQDAWLDAWSRFMALRVAHGFRAPADWDRDARPDPAEAERAAVLQHLFARHFASLRAYALKKGVRIFGDEPIYVSADGCDAWSRPGLFDLDAAGRPRAVAGVPPDYFCADGQLWGNPLYRWERHAADGFAWWRSRVNHDLGRFDAVRIDHFRGLHDYWSVPAGAADARGGKWRQGPGMEFIRAMGDAPLVAEDLGMLSPGVEELRKEAGLPGMSVLQFGFGGAKAGNPHHPENVTADRVAYTGTHDNDTLLGWLGAASEEETSALRKAFVGETPSVSRLIHSVLDSPAVAAFLPVQDLLGLGSAARFNSPGRPDGNWKWRMTAEERGRLESSATDWRGLLLRTRRISA